MATGSQENDPAYWEQRAAEARRLAAQLSDPIARETMLEIARSYQAIADLAKTRPISKPSP